MTGFGTWGNQQVTAIDKEDWINLDFSKDLDTGALTSLDFGARYADHERETQSPEGASPGDIWSDLQTGETALYPGDFAGDIGGTFPRDLWYFTPGALKEAILANSTWLSDNDGPSGRHNYGGEWKVAREESRRLRAGELRRRDLERQRRRALRRHRPGDQFLPGGCERSECRRQQPLRQLDLPGHQQQAQQGAAEREPEVQAWPTTWCCASPLRRP